MDVITEALHMRVATGDETHPSVTPVYRTSAFSAGSSYFYTRKDNPNVAELEQVVAALEGAKHGLAVSCGMAAIYSVLDLLRPGQTVVLNQDIYGCTFKLFQRMAERRGWQLQVADLSTAEGRRAIRADTNMVFFETPTNPFLKVIDIAAVAARAREVCAGALVVVDNTWATPLYQHPLEHGADISLHSGTKYFSGHSDVMNGVLLTDRDDLRDELRTNRFYAGSLLAPDSAWLVRRSLQTLELRLRQQTATTREMVDFLREQPEVEQVYYPVIDGKQLRDYGGIVFIRLRADLAPRYAELAAALRYFDTGTGMACVTSMIAQPYTGSHASMSAEEKAAIGLDHSLVRLCFGLESAEALRRDLRDGFAALS